MINETLGLTDYLYEIVYRKHFHMFAHIKTNSIILVALIACTLTGCMNRSNDITGSIRTNNPDELRALEKVQGDRYSQRPGEKNAGMAYAQTLRALGQTSQAVAVLQSTAIANQKDNEVQAAFGKALAEAGQLEQAANVLASAHSPDRPDWRILSAQGTVADQQNNHEKAQGFYKQALSIAPNEPSVLSNLGLSFALSKQLTVAESTLRVAVAQPKADPRIRGNLALVLALQGKFAESEDMARRDLPPAEAEANIAYMRQMLSQQNRWKQIEKAEKTTAKKLPKQG
jgi:Flp pilus assembly protein TadD